MKIDIMNIDKFVEVNNIQEVFDPVYFDKGKYPTTNGLFSYEIFGRPGSFDRKTNYAYIELKDNFLHPLVYKNLIRLNRKLEDLISGLSYFKLDENGYLIKVENEEDGDTGLDFLYNNWNKINFQSTESNKRDERIDFVKALKKNDAFISKWVVMPAFYRDADFTKLNSGVIAVDEVNYSYSKLIRLVKALDENNYSGIDFISNSTKGSIQKYLVDIFDATIGLTKKKTGIFRQAVMGKSVDFASRNVISCASFNVDKYSDLKVDMTHTGCPIATLLSTFNPFIIKWVVDLFKNNLSDESIVYFEDKKSILKDIDTQKVLEQFSYDKIKEKINLYIKAPSERFESIYIETKDGKKYPLKYIGFNKDPDSSSSSESSISKRNLTWTDVFYQACVDVTKDKYIYVTRYPLEDYFGIYPSKVTVLSTFKTTPQYISGKYYEFYPVIDPDMDKEEVRGLFIDSLQVCNAYLNGLGGDFDGKINNYLNKIS